MIDVSTTWAEVIIYIKKMMMTSGQVFKMSITFTDISPPQDYTQVSAGFEHMISAMPVQSSTNWVNKPIGSR